VSVKRAAEQLLELYPDRFTTDFCQNRKVLEELLEVQSKHLKNKIAGYLTSLLRQRTG